MRPDAPLTLTLESLTPESRRRLEDFKRIADLAGRDLLISDAINGHFIDFNEAAAAHLGYSREELLRLNPEALQADPDHDAEWVAERRAALVAAGGGAFLTRHRCKSGAIQDVWVSHTVVSLDAHPLIVSVVADRTHEQRAISRLEAQIALLADGESLSGIGTWEFRCTDGSMRWSPQVHRLCKTDPSTYAPTLWGYSTLVHPDDRPRWRRDFQQSINRGDPLISRHRLAFLDGSETRVELRGEVLLDDEGRPERVIATLCDINLLATARQQLEDLRHGDPLTGLPNKQASLEELSQRLRGRAYGQSLAVLSLDIDGFQEINDSFGPEVGDQLLQRIAVQLAVILGPRAWLARLSSDEFLVVQHDEIRSLGDAMALARRIEQLWTEQPPLMPQLRLNPSLCIGIASYPEHAQDPQGLLQCANTALTQAKRLGRGQICAYSSTLSRQIRERLELDGELAQALDSEQLRLLIQPQVHRSGALIGGEVLLRWTNRRGISIPPAQFIPLAEQSGLIVPLSQWTLERLLERLQLWGQSALPLPRLALNVSPRQLELPSRHFVGCLLDTLEAFSLSPQQLELEITESVLLRNPLVAREQLIALAEQGFRIAIDDFGTGYSSLELLRSLPVHRLKIDRTFVSSLVESPEDQAIVQATITLAHGLGMECIAEGVETREQQQCLAQLGCELYQGYLYSRPLELEAFESLLRQPGEAAIEVAPIRLESAGGRGDERPVVAGSRAPSTSAQLRLLRTALDLGQDEFLLLQAERGLRGEVEDFLILDANQAACDYMHQERDAVVGQMLLAIFPRVKESGLFQIYVDTLQRGASLTLEGYAYVDHDLFDDDRVYDITISPVQDFLVLTWHDVTGRSQSYRSFADAAALYRLLAENIVEVVVLLDQEQIIRWVSPSLQPMTGWTPLQWHGRAFPELFASFEQSEAGIPAPVDLRLWMAGFGPIRQGRLRLLQPDGRWGWIELSVRRLQGVGRRRFEGVLRSGDGSAPISLQDGFVITLNPVDGQVLQEQRLLRQVTTDPLTGLSSRAATLDWLQARLARGQLDQPQRLALLFCDFDNFKAINDGHGHAAGDLVLTTTAERIKATIRQNDRAGRLGGDEFLVLLDEIPSLEQAMVVADKLQKATAVAIPYGDGLIDVSLSIGVALHGAGEDADLFLRRADRAMFAAKAAGRNQVVAL